MSLNVVLGGAQLYMSRAAGADWVVLKLEKLTYEQLTQPIPVHRVGNSCRLAVAAQSYQLRLLKAG